MYSDKVVSEGGVFKTLVFGYGKAILVAMGFTLVVFFAAALLLTYTGMPESAIPFITTLTLVVSVVLCGVVSAGTGRSRGYLNGAIVGILYALMLYVVSLLVSGSFYCSTYILILLAIGIFGGACGGILGVNMAIRRRRH